MDEDLWEEIKALSGQRLRTLARYRPFFLLRVDPRDAVILVSTGKVRRIPRKQIQAAWTRLTQRGKISREDIERFCSPRHSSFVAVLLSRLPKVRYLTQPIRLYYQGDDSSTPTQPGLFA